MKKIIFLIIFILLSSFVLALEDYDYTGTTRTAVQGTESARNIIPNVNGYSLVFGIDGSAERLYNYSSDYVSYYNFINVNANGTGINAKGVGYDVGNHYIYVYDSAIIWEYDTDFKVTGNYWNFNNTFGTGAEIDSLIKIGSTFYGEVPRTSLPTIYFKTTDYFNTYDYTYLSSLGNFAKGGVMYDTATGNLLLRDYNATSDDVLVMVNSDLVPTGFNYTNPEGQVNLFAMITDEDAGFHYLLSGNAIMLLYYLSVYPTQIAIPSDINMGFLTSNTKNFSLYVSSYNKINISWYDTYQNATQYLTGTVGGANDTYDSANVNIVLMSIGNDEILKVTSKTSNYLTNFSISAYHNINYTDFSEELKLNISENILPVTKKANFIDISMGLLSSRQRFFNDYYLNYNIISVEFIDSYESETLSLITIKNGITDIYLTGNIAIALVPSENNIELYVESFLTNFTTNLLITARNSYGYIQSYPLRINVSSSLPSGIEEIQGVGTDNFVDELFPPYNTISVGSRYSYAFMTMIVSFILFVIGGFVIKDKHGSGSSTTIFMYLGGLVVGVEFIYFTAIKYIPVMITILIGLIVSFLIFYLFRKTTGV